MENVENVALIEHIIRGLAKIHGEENVKFYKELCEEIFCRYAGFEDYAAGSNTLHALIHQSFEKGVKKNVSRIRSKSNV